MQLNKSKIIIIFLFIAVLIVFGAIYFYKYIQNKQYNEARSQFIKTQSGKHYSIGVLAIALGRYNVFWKEFYESGEKYFFPGQDVQYYLFTDSPKVAYQNAPNVHVVPTQSMKWPYPALLRYDIFLSQKEALKKFDYLFYFNMDSVFRNFIGEDILPKADNDGLVFVKHCIFNEHSLPKDRPYERNPKSAAYVPYGKEGKYYVPGGLNGGTSKSFVKFSEYCSKNIHKDLANKIIPRWHDEAYTNKYILDKNPLILSPKYMYPYQWHEAAQFEPEIKAELRNRKHYGGRLYLKGLSNIKSTPYTRLKYKILSLISPQIDRRAKYKKIYKNLLW